MMAEPEKEEVPSEEQQHPSNSSSEDTVPPSRSQDAGEPEAEGGAAPIQPPVAGDPSLLQYKIRRFFVLRVITLVSTCKETFTTCVLEMA